MATIESLQLRHDFSADDKALLADQLAARLNDKAGLEATAKSVATHYKADVEKAAAIVAGLSAKIQAGFEMRATRCLILSERPSGYAVTVRLSDGCVVSRRKLERSERQMEINADEPKQFFAQAYLPVKCQGWDTDACVLEVYEDEAELLAPLGVLRALPTALLGDGQE